MSKHRPTRECACGRATITDQTEICYQCRSDILTDLRAILGESGQAGLDDELATATAKLVNHPPATPRRTPALAMAKLADNPPATTLPAHLRTTQKPIALPSTAFAFDTKASNLTGKLFDLLDHWAFVVYAATTPIDDNYLYLHPRDTKAFALFIVKHLADTVANHDWAHAMRTEIHDMVRKIRKAIDTPAGDRYAGPCISWTCDTGQVWAPPSIEDPAKQIARCDTCHREYRLKVHREWLVFEASNEKATASQIAAISESLLGYPLSAAKIHGWGRNGKITQHRGETMRLGAKFNPTTRVDQVLYVIGDVVTLARAIEAKQERKKGIEQ